jgi:hypothetical protein
MRIYRITNSANSGCSIFAHNEDDAAKVALKIGHVKAIKNIKNLVDCTEIILKNDKVQNITAGADALALNIVGVGFVEITGGISNISQVMDAMRTGVKPQSRSVWHITPVDIEE